MLGPLPRFQQPRVVQYCCRTTMYCSFATVSGSLFWSSNQTDVMMPFVDMATHTVHFIEWSDLSTTLFRVAVPQNMLFWLLIYPDNKKWASLLNHVSLRKSGFSSILSYNYCHMITLLTLSPGVNFICIL